MTHIAGKTEWFMASSSLPFTVLSFVERSRNTELWLPVSQNSENVALGHSWALSGTWASNPATHIVNIT